MKSENRFEPLFVAGPTASGKSAVAAELAIRTGGEIVNADAFQLYRRLDILTAKPTAEEIARAPHHLYSVVDAAEPFSAAQFEALARPVIQGISARNRLPIVVGGSGLYLKTLTHGLSPLPPGNPEIRAKLDLLTHEERVRQLAALDPDSTEKVDLKNPRYVTRALEICLLTERPASVLQSEWESREVSFRGILLAWDREILYRRINERSVAMLASGAIDEVRALEQNDTNDDPLSPTLSKAIGIREIREYITGNASLEETTIAIQQATRRYAKRQITWFKREVGFDSICLHPRDDACSVADRILALYPNLIP